MKSCVTTLVKFADDMALIARLKDEFSFTLIQYFVDTLVSWFDDSFLELNV